MSTQGVSLGDIADIEGFVRSVVQRRLNKVHHSEYEELVAEGLVVLCHLWRVYDPSKDMPSTKEGHQCKTARCCVPSFAGYASHLLPPKMLDAWHALHPEHLFLTQEDGKRRYVYLSPAVSLDEAPAGIMYDEYNHTIDMPGTRLVGEFMPPPLQSRNETVVSGGRRA